jgi:hypothetical protein
LRAGGRFREAVKMVAMVSRQLQPHRVPALEIVRHELLDELGIEPRKVAARPAAETAPAVEAEASVKSAGWNVLAVTQNAWQKLNIREPLGETRQKLAGAMQRSLSWANGRWNDLVQMKSQSAVLPALDRRCRAAWQRVVTTAGSVNLRLPLRETVQGSVQRTEGGWNRTRSLFARSQMAYPIAAGVACVVLVFATAMIGRSTDSKPKLIRVGTGSLVLPVTLLRTPAANGEVAGSLNAGQHVDILREIPERALEAWTLVRATGDPETVGYVRLQNLDKVQTEDREFDLWVSRSFLNRSTSPAEFRTRLQQLDQRLKENPPAPSRELDQTYLEVSKAYARVAAESAGSPKELEVTRIALANSQDYLKRIDGALQISEEADAVQSSIQRSRAAIEKKIEKKAAPVRVRRTAPAGRTAPVAKLNDQTRIMRLANNAYSQKIYETAAMYCAQVLKINPNNKEARKLLATVRREQVELEASIMRQ